MKKRVLNVCMLLFMLGACMLSAKAKPKESDDDSLYSEAIVEILPIVDTAVVQSKPELVVKDSNQFKAYFSYAGDSIRLCDESSALCGLIETEAVREDSEYKLIYTFEMKGSLEGLYADESNAAIDLKQLEVINPYLVDITGEQLIVEDSQFQDMQDKYFKMKYRTESNVVVNSESYCQGMYSAEVSGTVIYYIETTEPSHELGLFERVDRIDLTPQAVRIRYARYAQCLYDYPVIRLPKVFSKEKLCKDV